MYCLSAQGQLALIMIVIILCLLDSYETPEAILLRSLSTCLRRTPVSARGPCQRHQRPLRSTFWWADGPLVIGLGRPGGFPPSQRLRIDGIIHSPLRPSGRCSSLPSWCCSNSFSVSFLVPNQSSSAHWKLLPLSRTRHFDWLHLTSNWPILRNNNLLPSEPAAKQ
jgi:hypothetical protein